MGRSLAKFDGDVEAQIDMLADAFAEKRENTLAIRFYSMRQLQVWLVGHSPDGVCLPLNEDDVYAYCRSMMSEKAPATRLQRMREALAFSMHTWGPDGALSVVESSLIKGVAHRTYEDKRILKQRDVLLPADVAALVDALRAREPRYAAASADMSAIRVALVQEEAALVPPLALLRAWPVFPPGPGP